MEISSEIHRETSEIHRLIEPTERARMAHTAFGSEAKHIQSASAALLQPRDILAAHAAVRAGRARCLGAREVRAAWPCDCAPRAARACTMLLQAARGVCTMSCRELCTGKCRPRTEDWALGAPAAHRLPLPRAPRRLSALLRCVFAQGLAAGIWVPPAAVLAASPAVAHTIVHMLAAAVSAAALAASSAKALGAAISPPLLATRTIRAAWGACSAAFGVLAPTPKAAHAAPLLACPPRGSL